MGQQKEEQEMALIILDKEVEPLEKRGARCICGAQAVLRAYLKDRPETGEFCAHCVLYSGMTQWGYDNRGEILDVGRAAQEMAAKHGKPIPALDQRGRLQPDDANRFMLGVVFSSKMLSKIAKVPPPEERP